ncbi:putative abc transporter [Erysiphe necator]|uniref:Putative abc transporter n=1 Tax=Uncinula necator TaxID=52586 RepID=A0A0B1P8N7_UNCNE|nr:putative abc transporter [Erysiphe necator]
MTGIYLEEDEMFYMTLSCITYLLQAFILVESRHPFWYPYFVTWSFSLLMELKILIIHLIYYSDPQFSMVSLIEQFIRILSFLILFLYNYYLKVHKEYSHLYSIPKLSLSINVGPESISSEIFSDYDLDTNKGNLNKSELLEKEDKSNDSISAYYDGYDGNTGKKSSETGNWIFLPYIWPFREKTLQLRAVLVVFCLMGSSALNILVPRQMGTMIDSLTKYAQGDHTYNIWLPLITYTALRFANGGSGISLLRKWLWNPIEQHSYGALTTASHSHLMNLSSDFHDSKITSDLIQAIFGGRSISLLLEAVFFQIIPMSIDLSLAICYLSSQFGPYMGLILMITIVLYIYTSTKLHAHRAKKRRNFITMFRKQINIGEESLDFWSTASLFNMILYEKSRYVNAVKEHLESKNKYENSSYLVDLSQGLIMALNLLSVLCFGFYQVTYNGKTIGQFTTLLVYWAQLSGPMNFLSTIYKSFVNSMMDAEQLLKLFHTKPTINDLPNSKPLKLKGGFISFDRVSFAYDTRKDTLKNISFAAPSGKTVALVGETGGGKSTILKLIDRFYDVKAGSISIDGQDIRNVTTSSLRESIGFVPQDPILFNDTIMNNIRYAKLSATNEEVFEACKASAIHEKILNFPDGYESKVGDRGIKLSGGEKQRIAIARVILKRPEVILLDEATSSVDTETEKTIHKSLNKIFKDRTTLIVAHRLSTIMDADYIYVVMNGEIIEKGTHKDLILENGKYKKLWSQQVCGRSFLDNNSNLLN